MSSYIASNYVRPFEQYPTVSHHLCFTHPPSISPTGKQQGGWRKYKLGLPALYKYRRTITPPAGQFHLPPNNNQRTPDEAGRNNHCRRTVSNKTNSILKVLPRRTGASPSEKTAPESSKINHPRVCKHGRIPPVDAICSGRRERVINIRHRLSS